MATRPTSGGRIVLAILAGAVVAPPIVLLLMLAVPGAMIENFEQFVLMTILALILGAPIAAASIVALFGPLWILHHRQGAGLPSFIGLATLAGVVMACGVSLYIRNWRALDVLPVVFLTVAAVPTSVVIWGVAYGFWSDDP